MTHPAPVSRPPGRMPDQISVSEFIAETTEDYNSPTTSSFTTRLHNCRNTVTLLEEVGRAAGRRAVLVPEPGGWGWGATPPAPGAPRGLGGAAPAAGGGRESAGPGHPQGEERSPRPASRPSWVPGSLLDAFHIGVTLS